MSIMNVSKNAQSQFTFARNVMGRGRVKHTPLEAESTDTVFL